MHTYSTFAPAQERENYTYIDAFFLPHAHLLLLLALLLPIVALLLL